MALPRNGLKVSETDLTSVWSKAAICGLAFLFAFIVAYFGECAYELMKGFSTGNYIGLVSSKFTLGTILRFGVFGLLALAVFAIVYRFHEPIFSFMFRFRYPLAVIGVGLCVVLEISGTSIGCWSQYLTGSNESSALLGIPRSIRSDEWVVNLPLFISQEINNYAPTTSIARGAETHIGFPVSAPAWSLVALFHPNQWGYLLFGSGKGVAFDWSASKAALFLVSFEFARIYTKDKRALSALAAMLLAFSPVVVWWNTSNYLIFGQALVVALFQFLNNPAGWKRCLAGVFIGWLAACYFFGLYPAWEVPFFFIFALFGVWVVADYVKRHRAGLRTFAPRKNLPWLIASVVLFFSLVGLALWSSMDAIVATTSTLYPSGRISTGGNGLRYLFSYASTLLFSVFPDGYNTCEPSMMFSLFPLGLAFAIVAIAKKRDLLLMLLAMLEFVFLVYAIVGFPEWLSRITLFSYIPTARLLFPLGCVDVYLLIRSVSILAYDEEFKINRNSEFVIFAACIGAGAMLAVLSVAFRTEDAPFTKSAILCVALIEFILSSVLLYGAFSQRKKVLNCFALTAAMVVFSSGMLVNPIQSGLEEITESDIYKTVERVVGQQPDENELWIAEGSIALPNLCISAGAHTINSVNYYPDIERWKLLDPQGDYEYAYNRYAHIAIALQDDSDTWFELLSDDLFMLHLNWADLGKLNVSYLVTQCDHSSHEGIEEVAESGSFAIYKVSNS